MRLIIEPQFLLYGFTVPRGTETIEIIGDVRGVGLGIRDPFPPLSERFFFDAQGVCGELDLVENEPLSLQQIELEAIRQGWFVADSREFASFTLQISPRYPNKIPELLLGAWLLKPTPVMWVLERKGWGHEARFSLVSTPLLQLPKRQLHVLLVRKYPED